jgi:hypothetical protein
VVGADFKVCNVRQFILTELSIIVTDDSIATTRRFYTPTIPSLVDGTVLTRDFGYPLDLGDEMSGTAGWKLESVVSNSSVSGPSLT